jgi:hypothetical protein
VKKNNSDNELSGEQLSRMKAHLQNANRTIQILRIQCEDKGVSDKLLDALALEQVPESTAKAQRLDEHTYVRHKMALRDAAAGLTRLFNEAGDAAEAEADI